MDKYGPSSLANSLVAADKLVKELTARRDSLIEEGKLSVAEDVSLANAILAAIRARDSRAAELDRLQAQETKQSLLAQLYRPRIAQRPAAAPGGPGPTPNTSPAAGP